MPLLRRLQMCWRGHCLEGAACVCQIQSSLQCKEQSAQELVVIRSCSCRQEWCVHPDTQHDNWKLFLLTLICSTDFCTPLLHSGLCLAILQANTAYRIGQRSLSTWGSSSGCRSPLNSTSSEQITVQNACWKTCDDDHLQFFDVKYFILAPPDDMLAWKSKGYLKDGKKLETWVYDFLVSGGKYLTDSEEYVL